MLGCGSSKPPVAAPANDQIIVSGPPVGAGQPGPPADQLLAKIDLPLYPKSKLLSSTILVGDQIPKDEHRYHVQLETEDSVEKVVTFYKSKGQMMDSMNGNKGQVLGMTPKGNRTIIVAEPKDGKTIISISSIAYEATH